MAIHPQTIELELPKLELPRDALAARLRVTKPNKRAELEAMIDTVESLARPAAFYRRIEPVFEGEDIVVLDGHRIQSATLNKVLSKSLLQTDGSHAVFPFAATSGQELTDWGASQELGLKTFWSQVILETSIQIITGHMEKEIGKLSEFEVSSIEPGIPADWLLDRQVELFEVLGGTSEDFGIRLNNQSLMLPFHYLAGVYYFSKTIQLPCPYCHFVDCDKTRGGCWRFQALKNRMSKAESAA